MSNKANDTILPTSMSFVEFCTWLHIYGFNVAGDFPWVQWLYGHAGAWLPFETLMEDVPWFEDMLMERAEELPDVHYQDAEDEWA
jgi:hypothetical protein